MNEGDREYWDSLVERGVQVRRTEARLDAELLGTVYELWCAQALVHGAKDAELSVAREFRLALGVSVSEAKTLVALAIGLHERLPEVLACMRDGLIDRWRAEQARDAFAALTEADVAQADQQVAVRVRERARPLQWRQYLRRVADALDPQAKQRRVQRARRQRYVSFLPNEDGTGTIFGRLPAEDVARCEARIDGIARSLRADGDPRTLEQLRADVTVDLLLGTCRGAPTATGFTVNVHVPLGVALHLGNDGCRVDGYGEIPAHIAQTMLNDPDNTVRKVLLDPDTGAVTGLGRTKYRPTKRLQEFIRIRDTSCRAPGCTSPIREIDHVQERGDHGPTDPDNLQGLCRLDHRLKTVAGWKHRTHNNTTTITTPAGRTYTADDRSASEPC